MPHVSDGPRIRGQHEHKAQLIGAMYYLYEYSTKYYMDFVCIYLYLSKYCILIDVFLVAPVGCRCLAQQQTAAPLPLPSQTKGRPLFSKNISSNNKLWLSKYTTARSWIADPTLLDKVLPTLDNVVVAAHTHSSFNTIDYLYLAECFLFHNKVVLFRTTAGPSRAPPKYEPWLQVFAGCN